MRKVELGNSTGTTTVKYAGKRERGPGGNKREGDGGRTSPSRRALLSLGHSMRERRSFLKAFKFPLLGDNVVKLYYPMSGKL